MAPELHTMTTTRSDGTTVIRVYGEIGVFTSERLRHAIEPYLGRHRTIILDLSGVRRMDSTSIDVFIWVRGSLTLDGGNLVLRNPSRSARRVLDAARVRFRVTQDPNKNPPGWNETG
jgi:anti-anti-sigma factor